MQAEPLHIGTQSLRIYTARHRVRHAGSPVHSWTNRCKQENYNDIAIIACFFRDFMCAFRIFVFKLVSA